MYAKVRRNVATELSRFESIALIRWILKSSNIGKVLL